MRNEDILTIINTNKDDDTVIISWMVTALCNYACDFCIQGDKDRHIKDAKCESRELRDRIVSKLCRLIEEEYDGKFGTMKIFLIGGEVTILPDCISICERLINTRFRGCMMIHITSNMSADISWFKQLAKVFRDHPEKEGERLLFFGCSYYKEYAAQDEFVQKLAAVKKLGIRSNTLFQRLIRKLFHHGQTRFIWMECSFPIATDADYELYKQFAAKTARLGIHTVGNMLRKYTVTLSEDNKEALINEGHHFLNVTFTDKSERTYPSIQQMGFDLSDREQFDPCGYYCDAGWKSFHIRNDGTLERCPNLTAREGVGNFLDDSVKLNNKMEICRATRCSCSFFRRISKDSEVISANGS